MSVSQNHEITSLIVPGGSSTSNNTLVAVPLRADVSKLATQTADSPAFVSSQVMSRVEKTLDILESAFTELVREFEPPIEPLDFSVPNDFKLSIVIPVFNERQTVATLLARVLRLPLPLEIIVVDDHSTDGTLDVIRPFTDIAGVKLIAKPRNEGKGAALRTGFENVTGDIVIVQDADLEYDPRDIPRLIQPIVEGKADAVYGSRFLARTHRGSSTVHQWGNRFLTMISNAVTGLRLTDMETCYKAMRRDLLQSIPLRQDRFGFEPEITAKLARRQCRILELPVSYAARAWDAGKKIGIRDAINALYCVIRFAIRD
jgi:glycosyltransferase involved in cell wall biosynthesis